MIDNLQILSLYKDALLRIKHLVSEENNEFSGCIYSDGSFSIKEGNENSAAAADSHFIWHSHPDGKLLFSLNDYLCIFYSKAQYAALFAGNKILVIKKTAIHKKIYLEFREIASQFQGCSSIIYYKFIQQIEKYFNIDATADINEETLSKLKFKFSVYKESDLKLISEA